MVVLTSKWQCSYYENSELISLALCIKVKLLDCGCSPMRRQSPYADKTTHMPSCQRALLVRFGQPHIGHHIPSMPLYLKAFLSQKPFTPSSRRLPQRSWSGAESRPWRAHFSSKILHFRYDKMPEVWTEQISDGIQYNGSR